MEETSFLTMREPNWVPQNPIVIREYVTPKTFLGDETAEVEWTRESKPVNIFLHTSSYKTLKRKDCLYLFGRRGTGKTAMMHMLQYEVQSGMVLGYSYAEMINQKDAYRALSMNVRMSPLRELSQNELVYFLEKKWLWVLSISAMAAVVRAGFENQENDKDIQIIYKYLKKQDLMDINLREKSPLNKVVNIVVEELEAVDYLPTKVGAALLKISKRLSTPDYIKAEEALFRILKESKGEVLVLVDSLELYDLRDQIEKAVITALVNVTLELYASSPIKHILVKVAFPSEIYSKLESENQDKLEGKNVFILWQYKNLVSLIAKRYLQMFQTEENSITYEQLNEFYSARNFLYQHFPDQLVSLTGLTLDTMSYIIRHTLKTPRQVILLLNVVLTFAEQSGADLRKITGERIVTGIHRRPDLVVKGVLDMYAKIYPKADLLMKRTLTGAHSYFDASTLDTLLKEVASIREEEDLGREDVKRLFLECCVIGTLLDQHDLKKQEKTILDALFEYQIKGTLALTNRTICVIHPMYYQDLQIVVDANNITYPRPAEDEERQALEKVGIRLGEDFF